MYNKLFTKILDSSVWLAPDPHRLVWITLIAAMDQYSVANFACAENLAARARVSLADTEAAIRAFEAPDPRGEDQEFDGRRIERVLGGWLLLNGEKYRSLVNRAVATEQSRLRMQRHRDKLRNVAQRLQPVTPSVSVSVSVSEAKNKKGSRSSPRVPRKRCPSDFKITPELREWAAKSAPDVDIEKQTARMMDWEFRTGKVDWPAVWRTWMSKAQESAHPKPNGKQGYKASPTRAELETREVVRLAKAGASASSISHELDIPTNRVTEILKEQASATRGL